MGPGWRISGMVEAPRQNVPSPESPPCLLSFLLSARQDEVQHLIERCLLLCMSRDDTVEALAKHASIRPLVTLTDSCSDAVDGFCSLEGATEREQRILSCLFPNNIKETTNNIMQALSSKVARFQKKTLMAVNGDRRSVIHGSRSHERIKHVITINCRVSS
ncbi:hypothetical protein Taro_024208 [Colocasia esculenta]|uniref:Uncharacterized protein n=1 Tax=Colocasia esculenta TaxID=4460 RepID=A0A843VGS7_COLES|nr:hypothetical protein [Colocasia esculenta]